MNPSQDFQDDDDFDRPSKSQKKRDMHELQSLGEDLLTLPMDRVTPLALPEILMDALRAAKKITAHEGRRRQIQYIGKLMRQVDPEPIREAVAAFKLGSATDTLALHEAERWREELMASDDAVTRWMQAHPDTEAQQLRSLVRAARKDAGKATPTDGQGQRHGRAYRDLFQLVKSALSADAAPSDEAGDAPEDDDV